MNTPKRDDFDHFIALKRAKRFKNIDNLSPELRALANEYGYHVVDNLMRVGVTNPKHITHIIEMILDEFSPTRRSYSKQGLRQQIDDGAA